MTKKEKKHIIKKVTNAVLVASLRFDEQGKIELKPRYNNHEIHYCIIGFMNPVFEQSIVFIDKNEKV